MFITVCSPLITPLHILSLLINSSNHPNLMKCNFQFVIFSLIEKYVFSQCLFSCAEIIQGVLNAVNCINISEDCFANLNSSI